MNQPHSTAFFPAFPINSLDDIKRLEQTPLEESISICSTYELFVNSAHTFGDKTALRFLKTAEPGGDNIAWSYNDLLKGIRKTANMLHGLGIEPSDAISILLPGCLEYHLALWGGEAACIVNPLNPLQTDENLIALIKASNSKVLIAYGEDAEAGYWTKAQKLLQNVPSLKHLLRVPPHDEPKIDRSTLPAGVQDFYQAMHGLPDDHLLSDRQFAADDVAAYFHTGGTTGSPKLARHTHGNQVFTAWASVQLQAIKDNGVTINGYPLFHVAGVLPGALASLSAGVEVLIPTSLLMRNQEIIRNYWRLIEFHKVTVLSAVPTSLANIATVPLDGCDISSITMCRTGAAPLPPELGMRFKQAFDISIRESWGMTEMAGISSISPPTVDSPIGCVGFPLPFSRYKVVALDANGDPLDHELAQGETGMLLARSPNVFPGYLNETATKKAFTPDGWLITGDLGFIDSAGRINLNGRAKDLIIRSAHNIDPRIIEDALDAHPSVELCAAVGAPDAYAGELPVAFVTLKKNAQATTEQLVAYAAQQVQDTLAKPKTIVILQHMPMTNVGKIFKPELRRMASALAVESTAKQLLSDVSVNTVVNSKATMDAQGKISVNVHVATNKEALEMIATELNKFPVDVFLNQ